MLYILDIYSYHDYIFKQYIVFEIFCYIKCFIYKLRNKSLIDFSSSFSNKKCFIFRNVISVQISPSNCLITSFMKLSSSDQVLHFNYLSRS